MNETPPTTPAAESQPESGIALQRQDEALRDLNPTRRRRGKPEASTAPPAAAKDPGRYMEIAIDYLVESRMNPRKRFDATGLEELTRSIREKGVLTPLLVRPLPGKDPGYEIAAGHRRFRAAKAAGLTEVPAVARDMTDLELLEVLVVENGHREDVHPLEEADGYRRLVMPGTGYDVARVAARVGRSPKYVYDRLKLLELTPKAQQLFLDGKFTAGHAILLARLKPDDQKRAIEVETDEYGPALAQGLFQHDRGLPFGDDEALEKAARKDPYLRVKPVSVRELASWIEDTVRFDGQHLDPVLFPETAATLDNAAKGKLRVLLITREYRAGDEVRGAGKDRVYGEQSWKRADGKEGSKTCERSRVGLVTCGPGQGEAFLVCIDKEKCDTHWAKWQKERKQRQAQAGAHQSVASARDRQAREQQEYRKRQALKEAERLRWKKARPAILEALAAAVKQAPTKATGLLATLVIRGLDSHQARSKDVETLVPRGRTAEDLLRHAAMIVVASQANSDGWRAKDELVPMARAFGLDAVKIRDQVAPPEKLQTAAKPAPAKKGGRR